MTMEENKLKEEGAFQSCDPVRIDCRNCVWAFVYGLSPMSVSCGKFAKKPNAIYYRNVKCARKKPFSE